VRNERKQLQTRPTIKERAAPVHGSPGVRDAGESESALQEVIHSVAPEVTRRDAFVLERLDVVVHKCLEWTYADLHKADR
jgi:hypothetical protein